MTNEASDEAFEASVATNEAWEMTAETSKTLKKTHFTQFHAWSCKRRDFHLAMPRSRLVHHFLQTARRRVINPFFAALRTNGGLHAPHHHHAAPQIRRERGFAARFISAAQRALILF